MVAATLVASACSDAGNEGAGEDAGLAPDAASADTRPEDAADAVDEPPRAAAGPSRYALVGEEVRLDGSDSTGATRFQWHFGDGTGWDDPREESGAEHSYDTPGRYRAVLTVYDERGRQHSDSALFSVTREPRLEPRASSSMNRLPDGTVAVVSPDSDEVALIRTDEPGPRVVRRLETCEGPRTVTGLDAHVVVACPRADAVQLFDREDPDAVQSVQMPYGSRPHGVTANSGSLFVTLQGPGQLARISADGDSFALDGRWDAVEDARGVASLPDGRFAVTRWRSPDDEAQIAVLGPNIDGIVHWTLAYDDQLASDTESGGVPSYLDQLAVSPTGEFVAVPSLQANIGQGEFLNDEQLTHETTVRAAVSFVDLSAGQELRGRRKLFDDRGLASAAVFSPRGDYLYVAMRGSRTIERYDVLQSVDAGAIPDVGFAPQGLALSDDGAYLLVDAYLSREVVVYRTADFDGFPQPVARLQIASEEPLSDQILRGKQLFNDSFDRRLTKDAYIACAHCHLDGESDRRTWDFTGRGEGLRNTISLLGRRGTGHGPLHWSANFDEVHDFENDIRQAFAGTGLMDDADWEADDTAHPLGAPKAGKSDDLDALAAYVTSLSNYPKSPHRQDDGTLTDAATRGQAIFESTETGCTDCHSGADLTDSGWSEDGRPNLHDVGTLSGGSGSRLGGELTGIDTPTLHGLWNSAPYLHDGSATTLEEVLTTRNPDDAHGVTSHLDAAQIADLVAYLLSLDGPQPD